MCFPSEICFSYTWCRYKNHSDFYNFVISFIRRSKLQVCQINDIRHFDHICCINYCISLFHYTFINLYVLHRTSRFTNKVCYLSNQEPFVVIHQTLVMIQQLAGSPCHKLMVFFPQFLREHLFVVTAKIKDLNLPS